MLMIMGFCALIECICQAVPGGTETVLYSNMEHAVWDGFTFMDTIFPLFLFIAGVAFPFSWAKQQSKGLGKGRMYKKIAFRFLALFAFGLMVNGFFRLDFASLRVYSVLGRIGFAWAVAAIIYMNCSRPARIVTASVLLVGYWLLLRFVPAPDSAAGPFTQEGNLVGYVDRVLGIGTLYRGNFDPEGLLSNIPAIVTAMLGMFTGEFVRSDGLDGGKKTLWMFAAAAIMLVLGLLWSTVCPLNKNLWSSSFVLVCGAYSLAMFALFYWIIDVKGLKRWTKFFVVIGMNSITAYVLMHIIDFYGVSSYFLGGAAGFMGAWGPVLISVGELAAFWAVLWFLWKHKVFLKV